MDVHKSLTDTLSATAPRAASLLQYSDPVAVGI